MEQKSILITGCSSGIGETTANLLKQHNYRVFATARKKADVERLAAQGFEALALDVTDSGSIKQALTDILKRTGGTLFALFNNAGYVQAGAIEDLSRDTIRAQFETNVFGPMELIKAVLVVMRNQGYGRIIQNSSILGVITLPYYGAYNASKFALEGFTNTLRQELRGTKIYISSVNPGPIATKVRENAFLKYQETVQQQTENVHQAVYNRLEKTYFTKERKDDKLALPPEAVANKVLNALESKHPKAHYYIGIPAQSLAFLRRIFPESWMDWMLTRR